MKFIVRTSEALRRGDRLRMNGIDPSLIFFNKNLEEYQVKNVVKILQGDKVIPEERIQFIDTLKRIGEMLTCSEPSIYLMFGKYNSYRYDEIPGYISVPFQFKLSTLFEYLVANHSNCRENAQKFIDL